MADASFFGGHMTKEGPKFGGSWNADKNWKKLREKHRKHKASGRGGPAKPELYTPFEGTTEGSNRIVSKERYELNFDLAFGRITQEEYDQKLKELMEDT